MQVVKIMNALREQLEMVYAIFRRTVFDGCKSIVIVGSKQSEQRREIDYALTV